MRSFLALVLWILLVVALAPVVGLVGMLVLTLLALALVVARA